MGVAMGLGLVRLGRGARAGSSALGRGSRFQASRPNSKCVVTTPRQGFETLGEGRWLGWTHKFMRRARYEPSLLCREKRDESPPPPSQPSHR